jgi:hypothetical protein
MAERGRGLPQDDTNRRDCRSLYEQLGFQLPFDRGQGPLKGRDGPALSFINCNATAQQPIRIEPTLGLPCWISIASRHLPGQVEVCTTHLTHFTICASKTETAPLAISGANECLDRLFGRTLGSCTELCAGRGASVASD